MIPRIHAPQARGSDGEVEIIGPEHHYLSRVLRCRVGDRIELFDGNGARSERTVLELTGTATRVAAGAWQTRQSAPTLGIRLIQAISTAEKMDWTLEKAIELGVNEFQPVTSARSVVRLDERRAAARLEHWRNLAVAACRQCGRDVLPIIGPVATLAELLRQDPGPRSRIVLTVPAPGLPVRSLGQWWLEQGQTSRRAADSAPGPLLDLLVGPEAGLDEPEVRQAQGYGFEPVTLGSLTLRTETAALAAVSGLRALAGEF